MRVGAVAQGFTSQTYDEHPVCRVHQVNIKATGAKPNASIVHGSQNAATTTEQAVMVRILCFPTISNTLQLK